MDLIIKKLILVHIMLLLSACAIKGHKWQNGMNPSQHELGFIIESRNSPVDSDKLFWSVQSALPYTNEFEKKKTRDSFDISVHDNLRNARSVNRIRMYTESELAKYDFDKKGFPLKKPIGYLGGYPYSLKITNPEAIEFLPVDLELAETLQKRMIWSAGRKIYFFIELELDDKTERKKQDPKHIVLPARIVKYKAVQMGSDRTIAESTL